MKPQNVKAKLAQFPEIKPLVKGVHPDDLIIHVEPLDKSALYREVVWASGTAIYDPNRPHQAGIVTERVYRTVRTAEGHELEVPNGGKRPTSLTGFFLRHLAQIENPCKRVIVWQQIVWYETQEGQRPLESGRRFGTEIRIDVYLPPKTGIERLLAETNLSKNVRLTPPLLSSMMMEVEMGMHRTFGHSDAANMEKAVERFREIAETFQFGAYFHGLREVAEARSPGKSEGVVEGYRVSTATEGNRIKVTIERDDVCVELSGIRGLDNPKFAISNEGFTLDEADALVTGFVGAWKKSYRPVAQSELLDILRPADGAPMA